MSCKPSFPICPPSCDPILLSLLLLLALRSLFLHALTPSRLASQLFHFAEAVAVGVALLARGFHRVDAGGFVGLRRDVPGFGAGDGAYGRLCERSC